eukprot:TRINITY_DN72111_c0_g1_i1.p1 TRINITY_DN72111_c0_g1~~TRINITY_DN72111_c0_g1_i1.p1  ORF type:complete len:348 (-),score=64.90 TRINITY_DN72111_c0_g1_i1:12-1055(-)
MEGLMEKSDDLVGDLDDHLDLDDVLEPPSPPKKNTSWPPPVILAGLYSSGLRMMGEVKSFSSEKGYGFINSQHVKSTLGCDVYFQQKEVGDIPASELKAGLPVSFYCKLNRQGKPQGRLLRIDRRSTTTPQCRDGEVEPQEEPSPVQQSCDHDAMEAGPYVGTIKSFREEKGYGFIACEQTHQRFNRDVFLHYSQLREFKVGDKVKFKICIDSKQGDIEGKPKALALEKTSDLPGANKASDEDISTSTATGVNGETNLDISAREADREADAKHNKDWKPFESNDGKGIWWWNEADDDWFLESDPGDWVQYIDPGTEKPFWWNPDGRVFWANVPWATSEASSERPNCD